jgi:radical SAM superfamily enzyme YgiQ (UPF0313 family)
MKQNVLFVNFPTIPYTRLLDYFSGGDLDEVQLHGEPLGILHLSSYLKKFGNVNQVSLLDYSLALLDSKQYKNLTDFISSVAEENVDFVPDIIACSINFTTSHPFMLDTIKYLKSIWPDAIVIVGGNHATNATTKLLQFPFINYVGRGEAEVAFTEFINCISENKKVSIKGMYSKMDLPENKKDQTVPKWIIGDGTFPAQNSDHLLDRCVSIENLDDLPNPDWEIIDMETYATEQGRAAYIGVAADKRKASLFTSRGCPYRCTFCATHTTFTRLLRYHSPTYICEQIKILNKKYGITLFIIEDDLFTGGKKEVIEMLNAFKKLDIPNFELQFPNALSNNTLNEEVVDALYDAGMLSTEIAVESGSPYVQKNIIHKYVLLDKVKYWVDYMHSKNITVKCLFILGFPNETKEQMIESIEFAKTLKADWCIFNVATPLIGTEMYEEFIMKGAITDEIDFLAKTDFRKRIFDTPEISADELNELQYRANLDVNFINNPNLVDGNYSKALELYDDVLGKYPWHVVALCCKKRCFEGLGDSTKAQEMMKMINELIKTNKRSQAMLMKYSDLMEELQKIVPNYDKSILNDNKFDEALTLGTKTN